MIVFIFVWFYVIFCNLLYFGNWSFFSGLSCNALLNRLILEGAQYKWNKLLLVVVMYIVVYINYFVHYQVFYIEGRII